MLEKLERFVRDELEPEERAAFALLVAPGIASAYEESDVEGFVMTDWRQSALAESLRGTLRHESVRVIGLGDEET